MDLMELMGLKVNGPDRPSGAILWHALISGTRGNSGVP
jgi:hypothetical protein